MNAVIPFAFDSHAVRAMDVDGAPWFVAADIAAALEYTAAPQMTRILEEDEKGVQIVHTLGGDQDMLVINESGLFSAVLRSRKPEARRFRRWVTAEVLPALRRTGQYGQRDWVAEREQLQALVAAIRADTDAGVRLSLHAQLDQFCQRHALPTPPLAGIVAVAKAIGRNGPDMELLHAFFRAVDDCAERGLVLNHARNPYTTAINLRQALAVFEVDGNGIANSRALRDALRAHAGFVGLRAVNSRITGKTVKCWVFSHADDYAFGSAA